ncbi:16S rRNA (adenine(1518)-N(6)/adenine(1519)-N(6))-dimethyltransferase RsmA [Dokdonia donghaensis]|uniref:Ribosomal RNA small subunit methyltransferase A n=1 Tax=Dokdonia donghaensis DSW-1 TaxID=1300343 RepID=A0A0A2GU73_9FLAO|nr:16S rRNA (adenine(1518)-N(6)/adenine(1519)-N(6))-dimethyltransferase RsmA [Dokdonia donghaensis]ANH59394.1 Ribosomal RNA small subunit methyltransferase A [Dokdonia donghaensis DSW-1]KGO06787.1 16S rRNA methyltransferase [Dokdonia donghaensis DSW-1]
MPKQKKNKKFEKPHANRGHRDQGVKAKKHLGQHFLGDESVARDIGDTLTLEGYKHILEIGPGTGVLTKYILAKPAQLTVMDLDTESIEYLRSSFTLEHKLNDEKFTVLEADFLKYDLDTIYPGEPLAITGNFPYNISTQIVFKTIEHKERIPEFTGMFQKEVAARICASHGSKTYGILSVLAQAFYDAEYLFTVPPTVFIPPPKVDSGVLRLKRKENFKNIGCSEEMLFKVVKMAFQQRRKTLRNSLKGMGLSDRFRESEILNKRPEQISVQGFIELTAAITKDIEEQ